MAAIQVRAASASLERQKANRLAFTLALQILPLDDVDYVSLPTAWL